MNYNPYSPPKAEVSDAGEPALDSRPRAVTIALLLVALNIAIGFWGVLRMWPGMNIGTVAAAALAWRLARLLLIAWLCYQIARARNWARVVLLVLTLLGVLSFLLQLWIGLTQMPAGVRMALDPMAIARMALPSALNIAALFLLFVPGRKWFSRRAA
jgi:hypothetical protein